MRCPKSVIKTRGNPHNGRSKGNYKHGMRGHTWKRENTQTVCINCGYKKKRFPLLNVK